MRYPTAVFFPWVMVLITESTALSAPTPPPDWRMEMMAEAPAVRHPSVVCAAPDGRVFVAEDPMDISAPANAMHGRIICFQPNGERTVFATNLYAVFGMQYLEGKLYVLHNPKFSVFEDGNRMGSNRVDLIESTHPNPWALDWNDHVPANFKLAMDGYFYMAVGDKGIFGAVGRDGKRVDLKGGGILRLRPDGTGLEVFCRGVRNILDVALNAEDEIFTYDNTDEHNWMGRLTHMVEGGFYGYPHDFVPRRPYTLWMMADFGAGAATGAFAYTEDALPEDYRDNLFLADFGKRQILRVKIERDGATYRATSKEELFRDPPEDFRPVGIAPSADGMSIYVCDWAHRDTKENVEVGRLWKMTYTGTNRAAVKPAWYVAAALGKKCRAENGELLEGLSHPAKTVRLAAQRELERRMRATNERAALDGLHATVTNTAASPFPRWHALWALSGANKTDGLAIRAAAHPDPSMRRQAIRFLAANPSAGAVEVFRQRLEDNDASVRFAAATGLGRHGRPSDVPLLLEKAAEADSFARYAMFTAMNRIAQNSSEAGAWDQIIAGLSHKIDRVREAAFFALGNTYNFELAERLGALVRDRARPLAAREAALRVLIDMHHEPAPWKGEWWAYHPALQPPPKKTVAWDGTELIGALVREMSSDDATTIRLLAVEGIAAARDTSGFAALIQGYGSERDGAVRQSIIKNARHFKSDEAFALLQSITADATQPVAVTHEAIASLTAMGRPAAANCLADLVGRKGVRSQLKIAALEGLGSLKATNFVRVVAGELESKDEPCRLAAIKALAKMGGADAASSLRPLLGSERVETRLETIRALGELRDTNAVPALLTAWKAPETRQVAMEALARLSDSRALDAYLAGLESANPAVRDLCRKALRPFRERALPEILKRVPSLNPAAVAELREIYKDDPRAPKLFDAAKPLPTLEDYQSYALQHSGSPPRGERLFFDEQGVACSKCHSVGSKGKTIGPDLTSVGKQFGRRELIEHILYPSRAVREGYAQMIVETAEGETVAGLMRSETAETVSILDAGGKVHELPKKAIARRSSSSFSLMPEGLHAGLSVEAFADLIAYLESLKGAEP